jgi:hypothetical protein
MHNNNRPHITRDSLDWLLHHSQQGCEIILQGRMHAICIISSILLRQRLCVQLVYLPTRGTTSGMRGSAREGRNLHLRIYVAGILNVQVEATYGKEFGATRQGVHGEYV